MKENEMFSVIVDSEWYYEGTYEECSGLSLIRI